MESLKRLVPPNFRLLGHNLGVGICYRGNRLTEAQAHGVRKARPPSVQVTDNRIRVSRHSNEVEQIPASGVDAYGPSARLRGAGRGQDTQPASDLQPGPEDLPPLCIWVQDRNALETAAINRILSWMTDGPRERESVAFCAQDPSLILAGTCPDSRNAAVFGESVFNLCCSKQATIGTRFSIQISRPMTAYADSGTIRV